MEIPEYYTEQSRYLLIESDELCSVPLVVFVPPNNESNKLNSIIYYQPSPHTFTGLRIGYNQGKCGDAQNKECIGEKVDEVDQATEGLPFVVEETSYQGVLQ